MLYSINVEDDLEILSISNILYDDPMQKKNVPRLWIIHYISDHFDYNIVNQIVNIQLYKPYLNKKCIRIQNKKSDIRHNWRLIVYFL